MPRGRTGSGGIAPPFLSLPLDGGEWPASRPGAHWIGGWVGGRYGEEKNVLPLANRTPTVQPVAIPTELCRLPCNIHMKLINRTCGQNIVISIEKLASLHVVTNVF
jgi:hypothetical protein